MLSTFPFVEHISFNWIHSTILHIGRSVLKKGVKIQKQPFFQRKLRSYGVMIRLMKNVDHSNCSEKYQPAVRENIIHEGRPF